MKRFVWLLLSLLWSASCFGDVTINNPSGVCIQSVQWLKCNCYPWYTCCVNYSQSHTPPCPGQSVLQVETCSGKVTVLGGTNGLADGTPVTINSDGTASAGTPVIRGVEPVPNPGNAGILVAQTLNGQLTGNYVFVPPGGLGSLPVTGNPGDGNQWGMIALPDGSGVTTSSASGGTQTVNLDGTVNISGGTLTLPFGNGRPVYNADNPAPANNLPPIILNPPDWGTPGYTNYPAPSLTNGLADLPPGYYVPNSPVGTNNPTGLPTTSTNNLNNSTYSQGINSLYTEESLDTQAIVNAIKAADANNQGGNNGISNAVNSGNNTLKGISNHVANIDNSTQILTNQGNAITNLLSEIASNSAPNTNMSYNSDANTQKANAATADGAGQLQALGDKFATGSGSVGGSANPFLITLPGQGSWDINPITGSTRFPAVANAAPWVRRLSQWAMTAWFLFWLIGEINQAVRDATHLPQGTTAETSLLVGSVSALIAAGVVLGAITVFITYIGTLVLDSLVGAFLSHPFDSGGGQVVQAGIALLDSVFDIGLCLSLMAQRFSLSFYLSKAYLICAGVVRFAVG